MAGLVFAQINTAPDGLVSTRLYRPVLIVFRRTRNTPALIFRLTVHCSSGHFKDSSYFRHSLEVFLT